MRNRSEIIEYIVDLDKRIDVTLLSSLTEYWMGANYTMPQLKVMLFLFINGPRRMGDLASALGVSTPTVTGIINRLVGRGAVIRNHDSEDRRVVTCDLSAEGQEQISALWATRFNVFRDIFGALSPEELEIVAKAVEVILREAQRRDTGTMVKWTEVPRSNRHNPSTGGS